MAQNMTLTSAAFSEGAAIPAKHTCVGADISPALSWSGAPAGARSLALTVIDPDAPGKPFVHWLIFNLPASATRLAENVPPSSSGPDGSRQGRNDFDKIGYGGPCPPPGRAHHYHFTVYALDSLLDLAGGAREPEFTAAIEGHVLASGELIGTFAR
jgi:Raf kinase inhibitor-like YbhB/YbcL family protein